jgi:hypothetical protein
MSLRLPTLFIVFFVAVSAVAQDKLCGTSAAPTIQRSSGVIVQKVTLNGKWGSNPATIFRPDADIAQAAVVFSHSEIQQDGGPALDLLPFALTLAQAGAAVIVPERALHWPPAERETNREGAVVVCAEHWIVEHTKVFNDGKPLMNERNVIVREGYAYVGPRLCDPELPECRFVSPFNSEPQPASAYDRVYVWVPVGETEGADSTGDMISDSGLRAAKFLQHYLGLAPIKSIAASGKPGS